MGRAPQRLETQTLFFIPRGDAREIDFGYTVILAVAKFSVGEIFSCQMFKSCVPNFLFLPKVFDRSGAILIKIVKIFLGD